MEFSSGLPSVVASSPMRVPLLGSSYKKIAVAWSVRGDWIVGFRWWSLWFFFDVHPHKIGEIILQCDLFLWFEPGVKPPTCVCWFFMCFFVCILSVFLVWTRWNLEIYGKEHLVVCLDTWFGVESFLDEIGGLKVEITNSIIDYARNNHVQPGEGGWNVPNKWLSYIEVVFCFSPIFKRWWGNEGTRWISYFPFQSISFHFQFLAVRLTVCIPLYVLFFFSSLIHPNSLRKNYLVTFRWCWTWLKSCCYNQSEIV